VQVLLAIGGFSFIISLVYFIVHFAKYLLHPTSWGRSAALSEAIYSIERPIYVVVGIFLGIYLLLLIVGFASGQSINAGQYAAQLLQAMLKETVNVLTTLIKQAVSATP
jgi:nitrate reductase gamma subunit